MSPRRRERSAAKRSGSRFDPATMMVRVTQQTGTDQFGWVPAGADWHENAVVGGLAFDDAAIAYGFRRMADIAVENWITSRPDQSARDRAAAQAGAARRRGSAWITTVSRNRP